MKLQFTDGDIIKVKSQHLYGVVGEFTEVCQPILRIDGGQSTEVVFSTLNSGWDFEVRSSPAEEMENIPWERAESVMKADGLDPWSIFRIMSLARRYLAIRRLKDNEKEDNS